MASSEHFFVYSIPARVFLPIHDLIHGCMKRNKINQHIYNWCIYFSYNFVLMIRQIFDWK